ncbi:MAG: STAS-like domain-containing protein [Bacteroidia bacterium]
MKIIPLHNYSRDFAENKDIARNLRLEEIEPELKKESEVTIDFDKVTSATQSFIHALISQTIRDYGVDVLERLNFKNCNEQIQTVIEIVVEYVQDGIFTEDDEM